jgi:hypothetical protein
MDVCRWERREGGAELKLSKSESELALVPYGLRHPYNCACTAPAYRVQASYKRFRVYYLPEIYCVIGR